MEQFAISEGVSCEVVPDLRLALERGRAAGETVLITGSFHTVGDAMSLLQLPTLSS